MITSKKIISQIYKNVDKKRWECLAANCSNFAINSHLLQKNGILSKISEEGHLIEMKPKDLFNKSVKPFAEFKKVGVNRALIIPLFCNYHDTAIFKSIESESINIDDYKSCLLLSFRTVCSELRKKERNLVIHERIIKSKHLDGKINKEIIKVFNEGTIKGIKDFKKRKKNLEDELQNPLSKNFNFISIEYPLIKVYGTAAFTPIDYKLESPVQEEPFFSVHIHLLPMKNGLKVIIGYDKNHTQKQIIEYCNSWKDLSMVQLQHKLTDLLATKIESWGLSTNLYNQLKESSKRRFLEYWDQNAINHSIDQKIDFNLFEGIDHNS